MNSKDEADHPNVIARPPLIFLGCAVFSGLVHYAYPLKVVQHSVSLSVGILLAAASGSFAIWAVRVFRASGTNVHPDRPSVALVITGPYRFTRNPMYLSLCLLQLALGLLLDDWIVLQFAIPLAVILHFGVILREERYLEAKFGEPYRIFKGQVRRWI
jgi:protein-S-isoprenylcysteine O-methyltransferase Ste14